MLRNFTYTMFFNLNCHQHCFLTLRKIIFCFLLGLFYSFQIYAGALTQEEIERASKAAQTEKGLYESGGKRDTDVIPLEMDKPKPAQLDHIQQADKKVAEKEAAKRAAEIQAANAKIKPLVDKLRQGRIEHDKQIKNLQSGLNNLNSQLDQAKQDKKKAEAELKTYSDKQDAVDYAGSALDGLAGIDNLATQLRNKIAAADKNIKTLTPQVENQQTAIANKQKEKFNYERRIRLEIVKAHPELRAREEATRLEEVAQFTRDIETQKKQIEAGEAAFDAQIEQLTKAIALSEARGLPETAAQYRKDKEKVIKTHEQWRKSQNSELDRYQKAREQAFEQNRNDGIGATNSGQVRSELRQAARERGEDPAKLNLVDEEAVASTGSSAGQIAKGAPRNTEFKSIFNEISSENVKDFFQDLQEDDLTWYEFSLRFGAYSKGVGRAGLDAVKDILVLIKEAGDTTGEAFEVMLEERLGIDSNLFGRENLELLEKFRDKSAILFDLDNPEGAKLASELVEMAKQLSKRAEREVEKTAGSGDDKKALEGTGYVAGTVLGVEEVPLRLAGATAKGARGLWRMAKKADDIPTGGGARRAIDDVAAPTAKGAKPNKRPTTGDKAAATPEPELGPGQGGVHPAAPSSKGRVTDKCPVGPGRLDLGSRFSRALSKIKSNIVRKHAEVFSDIAKRRNEVIMVRPVNPHSTGLIEKGFATKGMGIKGKSADWGPHAGTIPVDPKYSKLGNPKVKKPSAEKLRTYENYNKRALGEPYQVQKTDAAGNKVWVDMPAEQPIAKMVPHEGPDGKTIQVLGDIESGKPITADYDLFAVGTQKGTDHVRSFDPEKGIISEAEVITMDEINKGVKDVNYTGGNVVHHGGANRFANELDAVADFPITAFTPDGNVHSINNVNELNDFYNTWNQLGYNLDAMPGWGLDPNMAISGKFAPLTDGPGLAKRAASTGIGIAGLTTRECQDPSLAEQDTKEQEEDAEVAQPTKKDKSRPTTGDGGGASDDTEISIGGGFEGFQVVPPIYFAFGPGGYIEEEESWISLQEEEEEETGLMVEEEEETGLMVEEEETGLSTTATAKPKVRIINVISIQGNNPYDRRDPAEDKSKTSQSSQTPHTASSVGSTSPVATVQVINNIPVSRLFVVGAEAGCPASHYHGDANNCNGVFTADPNPPGCGHGVVSSVVSIPVTSCPDL